MQHLVKAQDVKEGVILPLGWETQDVMAYVKLRAKCLVARRLEALLNHRRAVKIDYAGRSVLNFAGPGDRFKKGEEL